MKTLFFVFLVLSCTEACWLYDKGKTVEKIKKNLAVQQRDSVDRQYFKDEMEKMNDSILRDSTYLNNYADESKMVSDLRSPNNELNRTHHEHLRKSKD